MPLHELLILRHGETEWNREGRWQGDLDSPLTAEGEVQAIALGHLLAGMGVGPDSHAFYSSPIRRARRTAKIAIRAMDAGRVRLIEDARLREISVGAWTGRSREDIRAESGLDENAHFMEYYAAAPGGESFAQMAHRIDGFLTTVTRPSVIFTHGITSRVIRARALGWEVDRLAELPGGQGVIHRVRDGYHSEHGAESG